MIIILIYRILFVSLSIKHLTIIARSGKLRVVHTYWYYIIRPLRRQLKNCTKTFFYTEPIPFEMKTKSILHVEFIQGKNIGIPPHSFFFFFFFGGRGWCCLLWGCPINHFGSSRFISYLEYNMLLINFNKFTLWLLLSTPLLRSLHGLRNALLRRLGRWKAAGRCRGAARIPNSDPTAISVSVGGRPLLILGLAEKLLVQPVAAHDVGTTLVEVKVTAAQKRIRVEILYACLEIHKKSGRKL